MTEDKKWELLNMLLRALEETPPTERIISLIQEINSFGVGVKFYFEFAPKRKHGPEDKGKALTKAPGLAKFRPTRPISKEQMLKRRRLPQNFKRLRKFEPDGNPNNN